MHGKLDESEVLPWLNALATFNEVIIACPQHLIWKKFLLKALNEMAPTFIRHIQHFKNVGLNPEITVKCTSAGIECVSTVPLSEKECTELTSAVSKVRLETRFSEKGSVAATLGNNKRFEDLKATNFVLPPDAVDVELSNLPPGERAFVEHPAHINYMMRVLPTIPRGQRFFIEIAKGEIWADGEAYAPTEEERKAMRRAWAYVKGLYPELGLAALIYMSRGVDADASGQSPANSSMDPSD